MAAVGDKRLRSPGVRFKQGPTGLIVCDGRRTAAVVSGPDRMGIFTRAACVGWIASLLGVLEYDETRGLCRKSKAEELVVKADTVRTDASWGRGRFDFFCEWALQQEQDRCVVVVVSRLST